ncbi:sensor histidine kinase [Brevibacterium litoralis]|uniref:sensor histidine kinase n=1 Tax=Brevibacterium litoralis TaxID=3138935 RepID=UPI0032EB18E5
MKRLAYLFAPVPLVIVAVILLVPIVEFSNRLGFSPWFMFSTGGMVGMLVVAGVVFCAIPLVHRIDRWLVHRLLGVTLSTETGWRAHVRATAHASLHGLAAAALCGIISFGFSLVMEITWWAWGSGSVAFFDSPADAIFLISQFVESTVMRMVSFVLALGGVVYVILYTTAAPAIARALLGPTVKEELAVERARNDLLRSQKSIARDIHDSVGHALTVTTIQAEAARAHLAAGRAEDARRALDAIEEVGREAQGELDSSLRSLREGGDTGQAPADGLTDGAEAGGRQVFGRKTPAPGSAAAATLPASVGVVGHDGETRTVHDSRGIPDLLRRTAASTIAVEENLTGLPDDLHRTAPQVSRALYAIVREACTNALRHGTGSPLSVSAHVLDGKVVLRAVNPCADGSVEPHGGLTGIRERCELLGGTMDVTKEKGMFRLECVLPLSQGRKNES